MNREQALKVVLVLVGLIFLFGVYPSMMFLCRAGGVGNRTGRNTSRLVAGSFPAHSGWMGKDGGDPYSFGESERGRAGGRSTHGAETQSRKECQGQQKEAFGPT